MGMGLCYNQLRKLEFGEVISLEQVIEYIKKKYNPLSIILYGSYANGTNNLNSDFDSLVISD
ncbi:MAG: nucleotidyltransferase domain-containing protein, partial [Bacteroidaceae bacterium]|nr:nucleotidyltransferase domain-containing protein [Bacteroidaceae bacterium]